MLLLFSHHAFAYKDQVVVETPNMVKTIYDVRVHAFIRHLYEDQKIVDTSTDAWLASFKEECDNFVQQYLAQNFVSENSTNLKPADAEVKAGVDKVEAALGGDAAKKKILRDFESDRQ